MKNKTAKATIWSLLDTYANFVLKFFFAIAITRILTPRDYGLVAYTALFIGIATWLSDWGFGTALIQKKDPDEIDFSTGFIFNVVVSMFFFLLYYVLAPNIACFFNEPELKPIVRVTSINLLLNALSYIHSIKLIKSISFKKLTIVNFISSILSGFTGLGMAISGYNYWSLIFQTLSGTFFRMLGLWFINRWIPQFKFNWMSFKEQIKFGSNVFISGLLENVFREIYSLIIGKTYQTTALGNYARGKKFYDLFIVQTGIAFNKVLYPTMVDKSEIRENHKLMYYNTYNFLFFIMAPLSLMLILLSKPLIITLLTTKWIGAIPYMQLYCIAGFIFLLVYFNATTTLSANSPKLYLKMDIIQKVLFGIALIFTYKQGIITIIIGWLVAYYTHFIIYEFTISKYHFNIMKYVNMFKVILACLPMILIYYISNRVTNNLVAILLINFILQPILYLTSIRFISYELFSRFINIVISVFSISIKYQKRNGL